MALIGARGDTAQVPEENSKVASVAAAAAGNREKERKRTPLGSRWCGERWGG